MVVSRITLEVEELTAMGGTHRDVTAKATEKKKAEAAGSVSLIMGSQRRLSSVLELRWGSPTMDETSPAKVRLKLRWWLHKDEGEDLGVLWLDLHGGSSNGPSMLLMVVGG